jgi:hypothetical protein
MNIMLFVDHQGEFALKDSLLKRISQKRTNLIKIAMFIFNLEIA